MELESLLDFDVELDFGKTYEANPGLLDNLLKHNQPKGTWIVEGYASTSDLDAQNHIVAPEAMAMGAESLRKYDTVLFNHDPNRPIGKVVSTEAKDGKLLVKVAISKTEPKIWEQVKDGTLSKFSIRGKITDAESYNDPRSLKDITVIKGMELHEVSLVSVPANPQAKSLSWYIEKALIEKKNYRNPGESYNDCVSRKIHHNVHEKNMPHDQAVAVAVSECGGSTKKSDEDIEKKDYPWDKCIADQKAKGMDDKRAAKVCAAIKNRTVAHMVEEWGIAVSEEEAVDKIIKKMENDLMYEYAWDRFVSLQGNLQKSGDCGCIKKKAAASTESDNPIAGAIADLQEIVDSLESGDKDQIMAIIRTLQAIMSKIYQKDIEGGKIVEDKSEEIKKDAVTEEKKEEVKKSEEVTQKVELDVSALSAVISQLQDMVKSVTVQSEAAKTEMAEVSKAKAEIGEVKDAIVKMVSDLNSVIKEIPIRKAQPAESDKEDRTKETVVEKSISEDENFKKANPSDQLHMLVSKLAV